MVFRFVLSPMGWLLLGFCLISVGLLSTEGTWAEEQAPAKAVPARQPASKVTRVEVSPSTEANDTTADSLPAPFAETTEAKSPEKENTRRPTETPSHEEISKIKIGDTDSPCSLNTFCLTPDGKLIAAVDCAKTSRGKPSADMKPSGQLRWFDSAGKALDVWPLDIAPTAVNVSPDGTLFVAGSSKLLKLDSHGKVLMSADVPNKKDLEDNADAIKAELAQIFVSPKARMQQSLASMKARIEELEAKEKAAQDENKELSRADRVRLATARRTVTSLEKSLAAIGDKPAPSMEASIKSFAESKKRVSGIAVTDKDVFVACPAALGFGYDIWRLNTDLQEPVKIVQKLRGCCGQMDIQARGADLCVAENSMHRVCRYDREGQQLKVWGEREGISQLGFEGCCNPMNLRIASNGEVYTSESSIGRIRRFSNDGQYLGLVGQAKLVSGCKHVAIGMSPDTKRVYLLDVTQGEIVVLQQKSATAAAAN